MSEVISRLKLESGEFDSKVKRAAQGIQNLVDECHKAGGTLNKLEDENRKYIQSLGRMETVSKTARGSLAELTAGFMDIKHAYNQLSQEEKNGEVGRELNKQLGILKQRVLDAKKEIKGMESELSGSKFGQFGSVIDTVGQKFGITGNLTEMLTSKTALMTASIGASIAVITKATEAWASYNSELSKQDKQTTVVTGLKGDDAKRMTDSIRAMADTYKVDFRQAVDAANTLMSQFGESGDSAIQLLRDGMRGMIQGDGQKLLSMIQQYAPAFRDAGITAGQLVAIIHNSEGGIFTDQNMNAIVMGIKNIRLMTKATSDALAKLGIDGQQMSKQLSDGTMTIFDALRKVSQAIQQTEAGGRTAGEVMQQVFGRQGTAAGTNLAKAIETLNTNLEETKRQTGEVGTAYDDLYKATLKLNVALRDCFGYDGWEQMATGIQTKLVGALTNVIKGMNAIKNLWGSITPNGPRDQLNKGVGYGDMDKVFGYISNGADQAARERRYDQQLQVINRKLANIGKERAVKNDDGSTSYIIDSIEEQQKKRQALLNRRLMLINRHDSLINRPQQQTQDFTPDPIKPIPTDSGKGGKINKSEVEAVTGSIDAQTKKVQDLQKAWRAAADDKSREDIKKQIEQAQLVLDAMNGKTKTSKITITADTNDALEAVKKIEGVKIEPKSFTVTAEDDKAADELRKMGAVQIADKTFSVISDIGDTLEKVKAIDGVKIDPKSFTVTAETTEALAKIQEINGIKIQPKKMEIQVPKMADIAPNGLTGKARTPEDLQQGAVKMKQAVKLEIDQEASKVDSETLKTLMKDAIQNGINGMDLQFGILGDKIGKGIDIPDDSWQGILDQYNALREMIGEEPIVINFKTGKIDKVVNETEKLKKTIGTTAQVVGTIGQAFNAIEDPAAKVAGTVAQAIANIAMAYSDALAKDQTTKFNIWGFIAAAAASTISMATTIAAIHSQTGYAEGGIVKGNHYSGDMLDGGSFGINAGELVLNRAQQGSLASQLEGSAGGFRNGQIVGRIEGEKIVLVANRYFRRTGQGEILTWK